MRPWDDALRDVDGIAREPERTREHARAASGEESERDVHLDPVQDLVVRPVTAEDVDRLDLACRPRDLRGFARGGREPGLGPGGQRRLHGRKPVLVDSRRERIDDEEAAHCGVAYPRMPSTRIARKRSASSSVSRPGSSHVYAQFAAESRSSVAAAASRSVRRPPDSTPSRNSAAPALLVPPPLGDDLVAVLALEVAPLPREDGRNVELLGDDPKVSAQRDQNTLDGRAVLGNRVQGGVKRARALTHRLVQELLLGPGERVERALLDAERLRERIHRRPVEPSLREEPCSLAGQRLSPRSHYTRC